MTRPTTKPPAPAVDDDELDPLTGWPVGPGRPSVGTAQAMVDAVNAAYGTDDIPDNDPAADDAAFFEELGVTKDIFDALEAVVGFDAALDLLDELEACGYAIVAKAPVTED